MEHENEHLEHGQHEVFSHEDYYHAEKITVQDILDHITGPVISIVFHILLITIVGTIIIIKPPEKRSDITVEVKEVDIKELEKIPEPPQPPDEIFDENVVEIDRPTVSNESVDVEVSNVVVDSSAVDVNVTDVLNIKPNDSALKLSGVFAARSGSGRLNAIKKYGGSPRTEASVNSALKWLADHQNRDGSWGQAKDKSPALTSVAILAFLAHGETPQSQQFGSNVLKGLKKLVVYSDTIGKDKGKDKVIVCDTHAYGHPMVAYAISEGYALTKIPMLESSMNRMIKTIVDGQNRLGGYDYNLATDPAKPDPKTGKVPNGSILGEPRCDLSYAGWNYQALKAAFNAGSNVPGLDAAIEKAIQCMEKINASPDGSFCYTAAKTTPVNPKTNTKGAFTMTSVGTLCMQLLGAGSNSAAKAGLRKLEEMPMIKDNERSQLEMDWKALPYGYPLYGWYYMTQAIFQGHGESGKKPWKKWNAAFTRTLLKEQEREGCWRCPVDKYTPKGFKGGGESGGGIEPETKQPYNGIFTSLDSKIWATCMCTLMLEVYYRYLPTFKLAHGGDSDSSGPAKKPDDDLTL